MLCVPEHEPSTLAQTYRGSVCMFVYNTFTHDTRVRKEAESLIADGWSVTVVALREGVLPERQMLGAIEVLRVIKNPMHLRFLRFFRTTLWLTPIANLWVSLCWPFRHLYRFIVSMARALGSGLRFLMRAASGLIPSRVHSEPEYESDTQSRYPVWYWPLLIMALPSSIPVIFWEIGYYYFVQPRPDVEFNSPAQIRFYARITMSVLRFYIRTTIRLIRKLRRLFRLLIRKLRRLFRLLRHKLKSAMRYAFRVIKGGIYSLLSRLLLKFHRPLCFFDYYVRARKTLAKRSFNVFHAHDLNTLPLAWWMARAIGAKLVYDSHEYYLERNTPKPYMRFSKWWRLKLEGFLLKRCQLAITVNESIAEAIGKRYGVAPLKVIRNTPSNQRPIDAPGGNPLRETLGIDVKTRILIYVGAITFNRGLKQLMSAMRLLPDCTLVLMGPGNEAYKQELITHAESTGILHQCHFFGAVRSDLVTTYAACADLGVAPIENKCLSYYYCSPNKIFEYVLAGIPVITSDFPEMSRVVKDYAIGLTFNPDDPEDIARAAQAVLDDPAFLQHVRHNMGRAAADFNWEIEASKLTGYYRQLVVTT